MTRIMLIAGLLVFWAIPAAAPVVVWELVCPRWEAPACAYERCEPVYKLCAAYTWREVE